MHSDQGWWGESPISRELREWDLRDHNLTLIYIAAHIPEAPEHPPSREEEKNTTKSHLHRCEQTKYLHPLLPAYPTSGAPKNNFARFWAFSSIFVVAVLSVFLCFFQIGLKRGCSCRLPVLWAVSHAHRWWGSQKTLPRSHKPPLSQFATNANLLCHKCTYSVCTHSILFFL